MFEQKSDLPTRLREIAMKLEKVEDEVWGRLSDADEVDINRVIYRLNNMAAEIVVDRDLKNITDEPPKGEE